MSEGSKIEWCAHSFNPWWGCVRVSQECIRCYAETFAKRYGHDLWGPTAPRRFPSEDYWRHPLKWNADAVRAGERRRVFCASMADVFEDRDDLSSQRARLFELIEATPQLDWLLLTKRPEHMPQMAPTAWRGAWPRNVWAGTTFGHPDSQLRVAELLAVPAVVLFLSMEPLLAPVNLTRIDYTERIRRALREAAARKGHDGNEAAASVTGPAILNPLTGEWDDGEDSGSDGRRIGWVIAGGESGHGARPMHPAWVRSIRDQCAAAGVPFFFKQWGEYGSTVETLSGEPAGPKQFESHLQWVHKATSWLNKGDLCLDTAGRTLKNGADFKRAEQEGTFPVAILRRVGKKVAGRVLDHRTWDELPEAPGGRA